MWSVQIWKDVCSYDEYLFCLIEFLNDQEGWYLKAYVDIPNSRIGAFTLILYVVLSHVWAINMFGSFCKRPKQKWCRKVADLGRKESSKSHCRSRGIISVLQFRFISFQPTKIAEQHPCLQSVKLSIPADFCSRTGNKVWGKQTNCWLWAKCSSLTLQTIYFSRQKLLTLLGNRVLQWLDLNVTPGLRITGHFSWWLAGTWEIFCSGILSLRCTEVKEKALRIQSASHHLWISSALFSLVILSVITRNVYLTDEKS